MMPRPITLALFALFLALPVLALQAPASPALAQSSDGYIQPFSSPNGGGAGFGFAPNGAPGGNAVPELGLPETAPPTNTPSALNPAQPIAPLGPVLTPISLETPPAPVVVEFFTSEGCATCLPAADYMRELAKRRNILPLSFHVDYWDYTGWQDRFADPAFAERQRAYAAARGKSMMYTPQMVIAGAIESLGTDRKAVEKALKKADRRHAMYGLGLAKDQNGGIHLNLPQASLSVPASLWLVTYSYEAATDITAGENRGKRMVSANVVRSLRKVGNWNGTAEDRLITLTAGEIALKPDACAIIANEAEFGPVVAAAAWDFKDLW
ncbi:MAG: DUF1223 domain-containing protein [Proteobacteria bacterium]|nr:DUF1223 domain-containing protein [Pseudomonadota bacterium]